MGGMRGGQMMFKYERATTRVSHNGSIESEVTRKRNLLAAAQAAAQSSASSGVVSTPAMISGASVPAATSSQASQRIALRANGSPVAAADSK